MTRLRNTKPHTAHTCSTTSASTSAGVSVKERRKPTEKRSSTGKTAPEPPGIVDGSAEDEGITTTMPSWAARNRWIVLAIASGACAAFNGVFAKLTTNDLSTHIAQGISRFFGLTNLESFVEVVVRCGFFGLNLVFNGVMWSLFTQALAKGSSTTQVSIMNTSTNFMITALLGLLIFSESLPPLWWVGAAMLVAGNVIIGRGNQETSEPAAGADDELEFNEDNGGHDHDDASAVELGHGHSTAPQVEGILPAKEGDDEVDEDVPLLGNLS
ncbi:hypothetical protein F4804DRAFT_36742 [Jackrogersella minutella]|nr:hypothetical protein F4804DRAFT_36742 [Jackrogersella minutella]